MIYLTRHQTQAAYDAVKDNLAKPQVAYIVEGNNVAYQPLAPVPPTPSHEYVDLGLPSGTKWATMNVGANSITDYGNYYQYGKGAATYQETSGDSRYYGEEDPLATSADTAAVVWGGDWHMPTKSQLEELTANTTYALVTDYQGSGINGATFTANGQTLFIPAAGRYSFGELLNVGNEGDVWGSTPDYDDSGYQLLFDGGDMNVYSQDRNVGYSVRPVMDA